MKNHGRAALNGVLKKVSRSFYLTIRILPPRLREPIGTAYLLARASDTIADSSDAPPERRRVHLAAFGGMIRHGGTDGIEPIVAGTKSSHAGETELMHRLPEVLDAYAALEESDRALVRDVLEKIIRGQDLDVARFGGRSAALSKADELEEYTYLVAGCVGEFWTKLCLHHLPSYSRIQAEELTRLGIDFGKGLQLVNILRDLREDLAQGRCYLTEPDASAGESERPSPRAVKHWMSRAHTLLDAGRIYTASLRPARLRAACFLPWTLGVQTLDLLEHTPALDAGGKVKVTRRDVRRALWKALVVAFSNAPLDARP